MMKKCPKCGEEIETETCPHCGYNLNSFKDSRKGMINESSKNKDNKLIYVLVLVIAVFLLLLGIFILTNTSNGENVLQVEDLQLNMTGYKCSLESNNTLNASNIKGYMETYKVEGNNDSFTLSVLVFQGSGIENPGNVGETLFGVSDSVSVTKYINGKYYWIQISHGNSVHNTLGYLESIILSQGVTIPKVTNIIENTTIVSNASNSPSNSSSSNGSSIVPSDGDNPNPDDSNG